MKWLILALFSGAMLLAAFGASGPAAAKPLPFTVTLTASPAAYSGPCSMTIKFVGVISGKPFTKLSYQIARVVGGAASVTPWTNTTMTSTGKMTVPDTITVTAAQAGVESETLQVLPGPSSATVKVSVTCATPKPTAKPSISLANPGVTTQIGPTPSPSHSPFANPGVILAPGAAALPPPINLNQALPNPTVKDAQNTYCPTRGGSACNFAFYVGLPAGKLALVWDYPYSNHIDGYNVYRADSAPPGPMAVHMVGAPKPLATQTDPSWKFVVLDAQKAGSCFAVTAYHGSDESNRSVRFCIGYGGVPKQVSLNPDLMGTMIATYTYRPDTDFTSQDNQHPTPRGVYDFLEVGHAHNPMLWTSDRSQVSQWANDLIRGYLHFNAGALSGARIAQARLHLQGAQTVGQSGGMTCLVYYDASSHRWSPPSGWLDVGSNGGSNIQGPDISLDVTPMVQAWANAPSTNNGIVLNGDTIEPIYKMVLLSSTCTTTFSSATLDVTYY